MAALPSALATMARNAESLIEPVGQAPFREYPKTAQYIHERGSLAVPDADGLFHVIVSFTCQPGYAAAVSHLLVNFTGPGAPPVEGDATSLFYALRVNSMYFPRNFGTINSSLGSLSHGPYPVPGAIRLKDGETLEGLGNVPIGSGVGTGAPNFVHCHLIGWQWPDRNET